MIVFSLLISFLSPALTFAAEESTVNATITVRIEGYEKTIIPPTKVNITDLDLSNYFTEKSKAEDFNSLKPIHAIVKALEQNGIDPKDKNQFNAGNKGDYISMINNLSAFDKGPMSGWMYWVDNQYADLGVRDYEIQDGQEVVVFYVEDFTKNIYSFFDQRSLQVNEYEDFTLTLNGNKNAWGGGSPSALEGATILVNDTEYQKDGKTLKTDFEGKASLSFKNPGTYHISASIKSADGHVILTRPYALVKVNELNTIQTIEQIDQTNKIEVDFGKSEDEAIALLSKETKITDSLGNQHSVTLNWTLENYSPNKAGEYTAIGSFELPQGVHQTVPESKLEVSTKVLIKEKPVTNPVSLEEALNKVVNYYKNNPPENPNSYWEAYAGMWATGKSINKDYTWESIDPEFEVDTRGNETIRYGYALLAQSQDPSNIWGGRNLFKELAGQQKEDGSFTTTGKQLFAMLFLDTGEELGADVGTWNKENKQKAMDILLKMQNDDGSFERFSKLDYTGWALIALSKYREQEKVDLAIEKALDYLKKAQGESGGFIDKGMWGGGENTNSNACVIQGLVAAGEDVLNPNGPWVKNGKTPLDALLKTQQEDGSFWWEEDNQGAVHMATKQVIVALADLKNKKSTWHRLGEEIYLSSVGEKDVAELITQTIKLPTPSKITFDHKAQIITAYNKYLQLPEEYRKKVTNKDKLIQAKEKIDQIEKEIKSINDAIWALPGDVKNLTLAHKPAVLDIIKRYENLSTADKKQIKYYQEVLTSKAAIDKLEIKKTQDLTDKTTGILVQDKDDLLPEETYIVVQQVAKGKDFDKSKTLIENELKNTKIVQIFDIDLLKNGVKQLFNGKVQVKMPIPKNYQGKDLKIYKILPDNTLKDMNASIGKDGMIVFETDSFSKYALVSVTKDPGKSPSITQNGDNSNTNTNLYSNNGSSPKTGDQYLLFPLLLFIASLSSLIYFYFKKHALFSINK